MLITLYAGSILVYSVYMNYYYVTKLLNNRPLPVGYNYAALTIGIVFAPIMIITTFISYIVGKLGKKDVSKTTNQMEEYKDHELRKAK